MGAYSSALATRLVAKIGSSRITGCPHYFEGHHTTGKVTHDKVPFEKIAGDVQ